MNFRFDTERSESGGRGDRCNGLALRAKAHVPVALVRKAMPIKRVCAVIGALVVTTSNVAAQCWSIGEDQPPDRSGAELAACQIAQIEQCEQLMPGFEQRARGAIASFKSDPRYIELSKSRDFKSYKNDAEKYLTEHPLGPTNCNSLLRSLLSR